MRKSIWFVPTEHTHKLQEINTLKAGFALNFQKSSLKKILMGLKKYRGINISPIGIIGASFSVKLQALKSQEYQHILPLLLHAGTECTVIYRLY